MARGMRAAMVAAAIAVAIVVVASLCGQSVQAQTGPAPVPLRTPVLSLRRIPDLMAEMTGLLHLHDALDAALADPSLGAARNSACLVVQQGSVTLYAHQPTAMLIPASNLKLLTGMAILDKLGPQAHLVTTVRADRAPAGGVVTGNLYLVGGGDPLLRTADYVASLRYKETLYTHLADLAHSVRAAGVTQVTGAVMGDESRYDTERYVPTWKASYAALGEVGPMSALQVNDGFATVVPKAIPAAQPAQTAAAIFTALLSAQGVTVSGPAGHGTTPASAPVVATLLSPPLADVVGEVERQSDNDGAELFTKELGRLNGGATTAAGVAVIRADLAADGLPVDQLSMVDGSGLDRSDRVSCQLLVDVLQRSGPDGALGAGLPVAAKTGTLQNRMIATPAAGRLRGKTGSLDAVSSLSGFMLPSAPTPGAATLTFSCIFNGDPSQAAAEAIEDRIAVILAGYPQAPPLDQLGPPPAGSG